MVAQIGALLSAPRGTGTSLLGAAAVALLMIGTLMTGYAHAATRAARRGSHHTTHRLPT